MKKHSRLIAFLLFVIVFISVLGGNQNAAAADWVGSGTQEDPFLLDSKEDLFSLQARVNGGDECEGLYFLMTQDIVLNEGLDLSLEWIPLGKFAGTLDGAGHAVMGMYVPNFYALLQRYEDASKVPEDKRALAYGSGFIGVLGESGTVMNLIISGRVEYPIYQGEFSAGGGICTYNFGTIENCASYVTFYDTGGLAGELSHGLYGGICPMSYGYIYNCVDESRVYLSPDEYDDYSNIGHIYAVPYDNYNYDPDICIALLAKIRFIDNSRMMGIASPETWNHYQPGTSPAWSNQEKVFSAYAEADLARVLQGSGQADDPYFIGNREDLLAFQVRVNSGDECEGLYFCLTQDIALNEGLDLSLEWLPLARFSGTLDGSGYAITGLYVPSILVYEPAAISLLRNSVHRSNELEIRLDGGAFIATLGEKGLVRNLTISGRIDCPLFNDNRKLAGGIAVRNLGTIESCVSYISFYLPPYCKPYSISGISSWNHGIISSCTDESRFFMDPAYPEKHPDDFHYVEYYGISEAFDLNVDDKFVPQQIDCVDHSQNIGLGIPQEWNHFLLGAESSQTELSGDKFTDLPSDLVGIWKGKITDGGGFMDISLTLRDDGTGAVGGSLGDVATGFSASFPEYNVNYTTQDGKISFKDENGKLFHFIPIFRVAGDAGLTPKYSLLGNTLTIEANAEYRLVLIFEKPSPPLDMNAKDKSDETPHTQPDKLEQKEILQENRSLEDFYTMEPNYIQKGVNEIIIQTHPQIHPENKITYFAQFKGDNYTNELFNPSYWPSDGKYKNGSEVGCTMCVTAMTLTSLYSPEGFVVTPAMLIEAKHGTKSLFTNMSMNKGNIVAGWATTQLEQLGVNDKLIKYSILKARNDEKDVSAKAEFNEAYKDRDAVWAMVDEALLRFLNNPSSFSPPIVRIYVDSRSNTHSVLVIGKSNANTYRIIDTSKFYGKTLVKCSEEKANYRTSTDDDTTKTYTSIPLSLLQFEMTEP